MPKTSFSSSVHVQYALPPEIILSSMLISGVCCVVLDLRPALLLMLPLGLSLSRRASLIVLSVGTMLSLCARATTIGRTYALLAGCLIGNTGFGGVDLSLPLPLLRWLRGLRGLYRGYDMGVLDGDYSSPMLELL